MTPDAFSPSEPPAFDPMRTRPSLLLRLKADAPVREIAWREFYAKYGTLIARYAMRHGASGEEAEDVVQDVMTSFYDIQPRFEYRPQEGRFRGFLRVCARNATISRLRKRKREKTGTTPADELAEQMAGDAGEADAIWEELWEAGQLQRAIDATEQRYGSNPQRRQTFRAFKLNVLLGHPAAQVAQRLGISVESVHAAKSRVTRALREELMAIQKEEA